MFENKNLVSKITTPMLDKHTDVHTENRYEREDELMEMYQGHH